MSLNQAGINSGSFILGGGVGMAPGMS